MPVAVTSAKLAGRVGSETRLSTSYCAPTNAATTVRMIVATRPTTHERKPLRARRDPGLGPALSASPVIGKLYELDAIAAVVIGGTALAGGRATIVGTVLGVLTFALIFNLMTLMDLAVEIQQVAKGLIIVAAVLLQRKQP